jgi:hypothetical protein
MKHIGARRRGCRFIGINPAILKQRIVLVVFG